MSGKLLVYAPYALWSPHYETELEIIESYLQQGYEVTILSCAGSLPTCEPNRKHRYLACWSCQSRFRAGIAWLGHDRVHTQEFYRLSDAQRAEVRRLQSVEFTSLEELRNFRLEGSDIGMAVVSSLVDTVREPEPDVVRHRPPIRKNLVSAAIVHFSISNHLRETRPDLFLLFNGRFAPLRPALRAAQALGVETLVHERAGGLHQYSLTRNTYPHDLEAVKQRYEAVYCSGPESASEKAAIARQWFEDRLNGRDSSWFSFTASQSRGLLPSLLEGATNIGIFVSSEDEFVAIDGWENPHYRNQNEGIARILEAFVAREDIRFFVREHPYLRNVDNSQTRGLRRLAREFPNMELVPGDSPVDTYSLIAAVDLVLTFGSTVGVEALYLRKPSILMGRHVIEDMPGPIVPASHAEFVEILQRFADNRVLPPLGDPEETVAKYGYALQHHGTSFRLAEPTDLFGVRLHRGGQSVVLQPNALLRVTTRFRVALVSGVKRLLQSAVRWRTALAVRGR